MSTTTRQKDGPNKGSNVSAKQSSGEDIRKQWQGSTLSQHIGSQNVRILTYIQRYFIPPLASCTPNFHLRLILPIIFSFHDYSSLV
jgi:hypothetical protein